MRKTDLTKLLVAVLAVAAALLANIYYRPDYRDAVVVKVYDGDTFKIDSGEKVRMIGIDTPEMHESDKLFADAKKSGEDPSLIKAKGTRAYEFTNQWLAGQRVRLVFDKDKRDKYGRILAYVYLSFPRPALSNAPRSGFIVNVDEKKWYFLNATILQSGYGVPMPIEPNLKHQETFEQLYQQAKEQHLGLWDNQTTTMKPKARRKR